MNNLKEYIIEKFKINKNIKVYSNDGDILLSALEKSPTKKVFPKELYIYLKEYIEDSYTSLNIFIRNYRYLKLDKKINFSNSSLRETGLLSEEFNTNFPKYESSKNIYTKYSAKDDGSMLLINKDNSAFYFNFYFTDDDKRNNPWFEILIVKNYD